MKMSGLILVAGVLLLILGGPALALVRAAPGEAFFFEDANFRGPSLKLALEPGKRHRLVPRMGSLEKKVSSIILGQDVKAMVFTEPDFGGAARIYLYTISKDMPDDDQIASIILCPKNETPQGVLFIHKRTSEGKASSRQQWHYLTGRGKFFPLPESEQESEAAFAEIGPQWNDRVRYVSVPPAVETDLFADPGFGGAVLTLPLPGAGNQVVFDLSHYGFYSSGKTPPGVISSLKVRVGSGGRK